VAMRRTRPKQEQTTDYQHSQEAVQRPDVGVQDQLSAKKPPQTYSYDSSLDPALSWDENRDRELAEWLLGLVHRCATEGEAVNNDGRFGQWTYHLVWHPGDLGKVLDQQPLVTKREAA